MEYSYRDELYHHGIKGQKWGVRRYQNEDGSLTAAGEKRALKNTPEEKAKRRKTALIVGASVAAAGLAAYGGYQLYSTHRQNKYIKGLLADDAARECRAKGEEAIRAMYDKRAMEAMSRPGAKSYEFRDDKLGYYIKLGK